VLVLVLVFVCQFVLVIVVVVVVFVVWRNKFYYIIFVDECCEKAVSLETFFNLKSHTRTLIIILSLLQQRIRERNAKPPQLHTFNMEFVSFLFKKKFSVFFIIKKS
jgi:hypothetical protein